MLRNATTRLFLSSLGSILLAGSLLFLGQHLSAAPARASMPVPVHEFPSPLLLCGERVPLERQDVWEMMDQAFVLSVYNHDQVILWIKRANRYFPHIERRLRERKMPDDLKYVAVVESSLRTYAVSSAKATGPWQFMEKTAKRYGLRVDGAIDERLNFEKATEAALDYLEVLYRQFGSWGLALAAYNCGEDRVAKSLEMQQAEGYYDLDLPLETERYIFRILSAKVILTNPERYGYRTSAIRVYPVIETDRIELHSHREVHVNVIARACGTNYKTIRELNPEIRNSSLPPGRYSLKVPRGTAKDFRENFERVLAQETPKNGPRKKM
ncbi:MAG: transglycosylase SLT domain-containing protein [Syntrophaceae bacterium]|nr:transglycosylase SLT domain-containing protein [Syntrophaceae bacterium]